MGVRFLSGEEDLLIGKTNTWSRGSEDAGISWVIAFSIGRGIDFTLRAAFVAEGAFDFGKGRAAEGFGGFGDGDYFIDARAVKAVT